MAAGNSYCVFHYSPSVLVDSLKLTPVLFPDCADPLIHRPDNRPECLFSPNRMAKVTMTSNMIISSN